jgi:hypothetical protein
MTDLETSSRGAQPSVVESFRIEGLYGYRTISLSSEYAATILIAKNGSGKTTLLAALDAFLRCQFSRLRDVKFVRIRCKLRGIEEIILTRENVLAYVGSEQLGLDARRLELEPSALLRFIEEYASDPERLSSDDETPTLIIQRFGYKRADAQAFCERLKVAVIGCHHSLALYL